MSDDQRMFAPSHPLPGPRYGVLTAFNPGTRTLPAGFQIAPPFRPLPVDIVLDKDFSARRALFLLKGKLGRERLLELLRDEIAAGDAFLRGHLDRSAGAEATGTTTLQARGITAAQFTGGLAREDVTQLRRDGNPPILAA